jgi:glycine betaine/proline transport system ATP-binding protein
MTVNGASKRGNHEAKLCSRNRAKYGPTNCPTTASLGQPVNIEVKNVFKIFGTKEKVALEMVRGGSSKDDVLAKTNCTVGLNDVSLHIGSGKIFVIMGLSGSGKSTLVRHFNGLIQPSSGEVMMDGVDVAKLDEAGLRELRRSKVSMVFQGFGLMPHKTALENAAFALLTRGEPRESALQTATDWLEKVGLKGYEQKYPDELYGGMKQRVGLARALAANTDVILMDEAFSALDPLIRSEMQDQLLELQTSLHKTIVFITHDLDEALRIGSEIAILKDGKLVQVGAPKEILSNPADDYVRRFVEKRASILEVVQS